MEILHLSLERLNLFRSKWATLGLRVMLFLEVRRLRCSVAGKAAPVLLKKQHLLPKNMYFFLRFCLCRL